jgi:hypothetical protein
LAEANAAAILVIAALELHIVEEDEEIGLRHAMQIAEPGEVTRPMDATIIAVPELRQRTGRLLFT